mgnify:CR=1 FL=1
MYYYLTFVYLFPGFAQITKPISDMKKADANLVWSGAHTAAVERVIHQLSAEARLRLPNSTQPFVLEVDHRD